MFFIISEKDNVVIDFDDNVSYIGETNQYPVLQPKNITFVQDGVSVIELTKAIPEQVQPIKYCYTEKKGFYPNPNWHEPLVYDRVSLEDIALIKADYTAELLEEGAI